MKTLLSQQSQSRTALIIKLLTMEADLKQHMALKSFILDLWSYHCMYFIGYLELEGYVIVIICCIWSYPYAEACLLLFVSPIDMYNINIDSLPVYTPELCGGLPKQFIIARI